MRTCLVCMPWHDLSRPSLAIGVLRTACRNKGIDAPIGYHGGLRFADFLAERTGGAFSPFEYTAIAEAGFNHALGDWIFAGTLFGADFGIEPMREYAERRNLRMRSASAAREHADEFVDLVVDELAALDVELIGFTTTFMQNVPSLAVATRLKQRRPEIAVVFGGGNCDGPMGIALHREFEAIDFVLRGECDESYPLLVQTLSGAPDRLDAVPGLCWRTPAGATVANPPGRLVPPAHLVAPDFDDWFAAFEKSTVSEHSAAELVVESARGCWWGEHHHCTFCGLNGTAMAFRAKEPEVFTTEVEHLITRHAVLDVMVVDNILEPTYLRTALPEIAGRGWDLRLHYEVKANLTRTQIDVLDAAGVRSVQPGIESLVDDVLARMNKGVRAVHNVRTMRDLESAGLTVSWNWLYGFPGERAEDYAAVLPQLPALVHLQPPSCTARIELNRFSPYFADPSLGFPVRTPAEVYRHVYDRPSERLHDLVYLFDTPDRGLTAEQVAPLNEAVRRWIDGYPDSSLVSTRTAAGIVIRDRRIGWPAADHLLDDERQCVAWQELEHGRSVRGLLRRLADAGLAWDEDGLTGWLDELRAHGLVFTEGGRWVGLATSPRGG
ncbi:ribosomal peptide maturation radical SAM protein 1 [Herbihabitans rhizosphaerae]|uniref:Ribosomal peptide maturation radical SAM protein 1 n=1 Tax=Herbihabitans rhizosphaerae TaxID=1872711 RepID=A0A4Q7L647_9PSEU|nr:RiPP maturation radical SAM C-methyltransferase [Herbihabitans rhizosphaerae]RZS45149.1 ribosomal peptide maturation radical SAM protein 1 [Herbihabitans rhizosphaerae]